MRLSYIPKFLISLTILALLSACKEIRNPENYINELLKQNKNSCEYSEALIDKVFELIENNPSTFECDFSDTNHMRMISSGGGEIRAYIFERHGTVEGYSSGFETRTLLQYKYNGQIYSARFPETNSIICDIAYLSDNKFIIIALTNNITQEEYIIYQAKVYRIDGTGINLCRSTFKKDGKPVDSIDICWEKWKRLKPNTDNPDKLDADSHIANRGIICNPHKKLLYVQSIGEVSESGSTLKRTFDSYYWNGSSFEKQNITDLIEVQNKDYFIQIEQLSDGTCIYRCWNGGKKTEFPDLVINNGYREFWDEVGIYDYNQWIAVDESSILGEVYTFVNNGYKYKYYTGWHKGRTLEELVIYNPHNVIIYSDKFNKIKDM